MSNFLNDLQRQNLGRWLSRDETRVIEHLLERALGQADVVLTINYDGEVNSDAVKTRDLDLICKEIGETGITNIYAYRQMPPSLAGGEPGPTHRHLGSFMLVHGNDLDVLSDLTDNEWSNRVGDAVIAFANALNEEGVA